MLHVMKELAAIVAHPSVAFPGFPAEPMIAVAMETMRVLGEAGFENVELLDMPDGYPAVWAEMPAPEGAVTVIGLDAPPTENATNALVPSTKAHLSLRTAPGQDAEEALINLAAVLEANVPWARRRRSSG